MEELFRGEVGEPQHPLLVRQVREQGPVHVVGTDAEFGPGSGQHGSPVEPAGPALHPREPEGGLADLVRRGVGRRLEFAAVFEELGQPLVDELGGAVADEPFEVGREFAAGPAGPVPVGEEELVGDAEPVGRVGVEVQWHQLGAGRADADELAGKHEEPVGSGSWHEAGKRIAEQRPRGVSHAG